MEERDENPRQDGGGLEASQHAGATKDGETEKCQLLQQQKEPKPKPKLHLTVQPSPRHEPKHKPKLTPIPARRSETVKLRKQSQKAPPSPAPALLTGSSMEERRLILRRDERVPPPQ